jgi:phosphohistidine phosphatase
MKLYLIRHGENEEGKSDELRALTPRGREAVKKMAGFVTALQERPSLLFASPLRRALETAEIFAKEWGLSLQTEEWLRPIVPPSQVIEELQKNRDSVVALVGHLPHLGLLLATLVWGLPPKEVAIPKGGVAFLESEALKPGSAKLKWLLSPEVLD